jgi:hypothetical protein
MKKLSRDMIDTIARAVVSGQRGYGQQIDSIADHLASFMRNRLQAVGARGADRAAVPRSKSAALDDGQILSLLLHRVQKHLANEALTKREDEGSQPR